MQSVVLCVAVCRRACYSLLQRALQGVLQYNARPLCLCFHIFLTNTQTDRQTHTNPPQTPPSTHVLSFVLSHTLTYLDIRVNLVFVTQFNDLSSSLYRANRRGFHLQYIHTYICIYIYIYTYIYIYIYITYVCTYTYMSFFLSFLCGTYPN